MNNIPRCEHPRPDRKRNDWINLNGEWDFEIDNSLVGIYKNFFERKSLDSKIIVPFTAESVLSGIGHTDFMNAVWYKIKMLTAKSIDKSASLFSAIIITSN